MYLITSLPRYLAKIYHCILMNFRSLQMSKKKRREERCKYLPIPLPIGYGLFEHGEFFMASTAVIVMHGEEYPEGRKNLSTRPRPRIRPFPNIPQNAKGGRKGRTLQETKPNGLKLRLSSSKRSKASILKHYLAPYSTIFKKLSTEHELMMA